MKKAIAMMILAFVILMSIPAYGTVLKEETVNSRAVWDSQENEYMMDVYLIKYTNVATNVEDFLEVSFDEYAE